MYDVLCVMHVKIILRLFTFFYYYFIITIILIIIIIISVGLFIIISRSSSRFDKIGTISEIKGL